MQPQLSDIGEDLLQQAEKGERAPRQILSELFPYIYQASERMSTRAISSFLKEKHGVQISQPTIVRALRNPDKHWRDFAEYIEPIARKVEKSIDPGMESFLFDERVFAHFIAQPIHHCEPEQHSHVDYEFREAVAFLKAKWFSLDEEIRNRCWLYFQPNVDEEKEGDWQKESHHPGR